MAEQRRYDVDWTDENNPRIVIAQPGDQHAMTLGEAQQVITDHTDTVLRWNFDKPHRCPACHAIAVSIGRPKSWRVYQCCQCRTRFTRWPRLARLLPNAGIACNVHREKP
ncbi:hypothetical protein [Streptomyces sp. PD-S100-1]|uniref:hypothetical protein n=1 Tax=Streptomyces sp. PD-S100-1 TaxID=3394351 RepID=UPI0039BCA64A